MQHNAIKLYRTGESDLAWQVARYISRVGEDENHIRDFTEVVTDRIRQNIEIMISILSESRYVFCDDQECRKDPSEAWIKPDKSSIAYSDLLAKKYKGAGFLVHGWIEKIGDVNINGFHESWGGLIECDPMWIEFKGSNYEEYLESFMSENEEPWILAKHNLMFAPDSLHKANISGTDGPKINLPPFNPEGSYQDGLRDRSFRDYLNDYFKSGGFLMRDILLSDPGFKSDFIQMIADKMKKI